MPENMKNRNQGTGKWCLFYDKINYENGLSELDKNYLILKENYDTITTEFKFKCSTMRPNPNAGNDFNNGVIIIYSNEETRDEIIKKIDNLGIINKIVYWKYHYGGYSKDGVKSSCHSYNPNAI